ncbi:flagellar export protein FliJ [Candidatus Latescibacterota bacterium]
MNRFRFRFQSVLRYREVIEESKKRHFGVALNHLKHEETRRGQIETSIAQHEKVREQSAQGKISARDLQNKLNYARQLDNKNKIQKKLVKKAGEVLESKRTELVEATKKKKIFDRLKEHEREEYEYEVQKEEQKLSDELSSQNKKNNPGV